ncbi:3-hydroxybutyrate dehydrogenase [Salinisphaera sp. P385]|uniref:3-hydroxybutyrate dehydrogenase n=1 Tax=Spectribacter acetivorans TaxID=3075603 RepID=A0ABU3B816_9GAMM|nr:3-hydroxybutyrate dehydrogenase [Salinisphaera sp. P385]MDT0618606.1 3-hydroxybutyrate dehydrogenase [Salinisphaera sp. P385]
MTERRTAIVTGSSSGIGLGIAEALARTGMNVMLNGIERPEEIENHRARLESYGVTARYSPADMTVPAEIHGLVEQAADAFGAVDIVVNNAGIQHVAPIDEFPDDKWNAIIAINLSAAFHMTKAVLPGMKSRGWGRIINMASAHGLVASPYKAAYVAAKHGVVGLTKSVALEVAELGITVNAICPGYVQTPLVQDQIADTAKARGISEDAVVRDVLLAAQPTKSFVTTDQLAGLALFLCSDVAASITGTALPVDGGWVAQ